MVVLSSAGCRDLSVISPTTVSHQCLAQLSTMQKDTNEQIRIYQIVAWSGQIVVVSKLAGRLSQPLQTPWRKVLGLWSTVGGFCRSGEGSIRATRAVVVIAVDHWFLIGKQ